MMLTRRRRLALMGVAAVASVLVASAAWGDGPNLTGSDLQISQTIGTNANVDCANRTDYGQNQGSPATPTFTLTNLTPGTSIAPRYLCIKNAGNAGTTLSLDIIEVTDEEDGCTGDEATADSTCGTGAGELGSALEMGLQRIPGDRCDTPVPEETPGDSIEPVAPIAARSGFTLPGGLGLNAEDEGCIRVTFDYPVNGVNTFASQSDRLSFRVRLVPSVPIDGGEAPTYAHGSQREQANMAALDRIFWVPDLDDYFVPQGLTYLPAGPVFEHDVVLQSGYFWDPETLENRSPALGACVVIAVDAETGAVEDRYFLPGSSGCTHAGGITYAGGTTAWIGDDVRPRPSGVDAPGRVYKIDLVAAFHTTGNAILRTVITTGTETSAVEYEPTGTNCPCLLVTDYPNSALWRFSLHDFETRTELNLSDRVTSANLQPAIDIKPTFPFDPLQAQGVAVGPDGDLWIAYSGAGSDGKLTRVKSHGTVVRQFPFVRGVEQVDFDPSGHLWGSGERGARKPTLNELFFPFMFRLDVDDLECEFSVILTPSCVP